MCVYKFFSRHNSYNNLVGSALKKLKKPRTQVTILPNLNET